MLAVHAHIARGLLESEGLNAEVRGEARNSLIGGLPAEACYAEVWVPIEDLEKARAILSEWQRGDGKGNLAVVSGEEGSLSPSEPKPS